MKQFGCANKIDGGKFFDVIVGCCWNRDGKDDDMFRKMEKLEFYVNLQDKLNYW